jgi:hypothetical protein
VVRAVLLQGSTEGWDEEDGMNGEEDEGGSEGEEYQEDKPTSDDPYTT